MVVAHSPTVQVGHPWLRNCFRFQQDGRWLRPSLLDHSADTDRSLRQEGAGANQHIFLWTRAVQRARHARASIRPPSSLNCAHTGTARTHTVLLDGTGAELEHRRVCIRSRVCGYFAGDRLGQWPAHGLYCRALPASNVPTE